MKITGIKTFICHSYRTNWVFVKVLTDAGIYGVGESTLEMRELTVETAIKELERYIVGRDPHDIEAIVHDIYRDAYWRGGVVLMSALAGVEMALWDIKGKDLGVPVYQLLGGKVRTSVPCYANGWFAGAKQPEEFAEKAKIAVKAGFKALKWDPFGKEYMNIDPKALKEALDCIRAVKDAVGDQVHLIIEGHGRFNVPTAVKIGNALAEFDILWFEEPIPPDDKAGIAWVRKKISTPVSGGERLYSKYDFVDYLRMECADYWQPDVSHAGGIMELKKIASMAEAHYIPICPHNPSGPIANAATLQLAACIPNFYLLETMSNDIPYRNEISTEKVVFENGEMLIGNAPGLGIDINEEAILKYPYEARNLRHYQGNLTDIRPADQTQYFK
ncbi:MAG: galactonate dehydratase [Pedobacter sp.]|uniref:galactonate dehydratase n=1 Tax=Pedobacter sp. TaxID=1411316 RepID=UPI002806890C|nr:galactonate dehydratase [Pedobacter sp.]MDQ8004166.1 galactonate dehydratase [Pedobacter sp.]